MATRAMLPLCPKCRTPVPSGSNAGTCANCGLVFAKYLAAQRGEPPRSLRREPHEPEAPGWERLLAVPERVETWIVVARFALWIVFLAWGWRLWAMDIRTGQIGESIMHAINLVFHEAGHVIFWPFGDFLHVAGGTLVQWLIPIVALVALHRNGDNFGASIALWWLAQSVIDAAPYAYDALHPQLVLLGGGTGEEGGHDWVAMLGDLGMLRRAHGVGHLLHWAGALLLVAANGWGAAVLVRQWRNRTSDAVRDAAD